MYSGNVGLETSTPLSRVGVSNRSSLCVLHLASSLLSTLLYHHATGKSRLPLPDLHVEAICPGAAALELCTLYR